MKNQLLTVITFFILFFSPFLNFAQAPDLGTAASFVVFSSNGAVSNTGTGYLTHLTGDVGTNNGAITGFGNVNGAVQSGGRATSHAATDLLGAYNKLDTTTPTHTHAPLLGNGDTLTAGVYSITGTTSLTGNLFLDARGNANAVFIFKIQGPLSTTDSARVVLVNNAVSCNVFWKVEGLVSLATATMMKGNVIANNAGINISTGVILEGRAFSTTGAITGNSFSASTPIGCGSAVLNGPAGPSLASAACFAIFSGNGQVMNSGTSHVTGDIGTNSGLTTGYDPLYVTGYVHPIPDSYTASCKSDLINAYAYLNNLPNDIELLFPPQFGRNLVLTPHTYIMNGATILTDSLYLDAEGNNKAIFIIKVKGAFSTSTFSKVYLVNRAQAVNVYWMVDGAVSINDNSVFNGTIVCNNAAITLNTGVTVNGRALTTSGALSTSNVITTSPSGNCNLLPVSWLYFKGLPVQDKVLLQWSTSTEINNGFFTIEKSRDGTTFETLTKVNTLGKTGKPSNDYSFTDLQPFDLNYYRISQTDKNGQKNYYRTIVVKISINQSFKTIHYVQGNTIFVQASGATPGKGSIELYSIEGKKLSSQKIFLTKEISLYKIEKPLDKGIYLLYIKSETGKIYFGKVVVL